MPRCVGRTLGAAVDILISAGLAALASRSPDGLSDVEAAHSGGCIRWRRRDPQCRWGRPESHRSRRRGRRAARTTGNCAARATRSRDTAPTGHGSAGPSGPITAHAVPSGFTHGSARATGAAAMTAAAAPASSTGVIFVRCFVIGRVYHRPCRPKPG